MAHPLSGDVANRLPFYDNALTPCGAVSILSDIFLAVNRRIAIVCHLETYWNDNKPVFKLDSVGFLYLWGSLVTWTVITSLCLFVGMLSYTDLPPEIPVQWDHGIADSFVNRNFIFLFPAACIIIRIWLRPIIYVKWLMNCPYGELVREYLSNYMCFAALSAELFMILFVHGVLKSIAAVLLADTVVLIGLLIIGIKNR